MASDWYDASAAAIRRALAEAEADGLDDRATLAHVDAAYPFGPRRYWPYKQWLVARRRLARHLLPARPAKVPTTGHPDLPGQRYLFGDEQQ